MNINYLSKTKCALEDLIKCLDDKERTEFNEINAEIYSLMFNGNTLKKDFSMILSNEVSGNFSVMMWNISKTGAYFGTKINN